MSRRPFITRVAPREEGPRVYSVTEIARALQVSLADQFSYVTVQGEISGWRYTPGSHVYFKLKDSGAVIQVALFRSRVRVAHQSLTDGVVVQVEGAIEFYDKGGSLSLVAEKVSPVGSGALQAKFEALKRSLEAEGLFRPERKRPLPSYPTRVAIVTSPTGAVIRDMIRILRQRAPYVRVTVAPAAVQGPGASLDIAASIRLVNEWGRADVIIVGRGGGSLEDLWAFNEESVVRAVAQSAIPVVSAVGHETDVTLSDLAADMRAATPTHAAQLVAKSRDEVRATLESLSKHARDRLRREVGQRNILLAGIRSHHAMREPLRRVHDGLREVDDQRECLVRGLTGWVSQRRRRLEGIEGVLRAHSPARSLERTRERIQALAHRAERCAADRIARGRSLVVRDQRLLASYDYKGVLRRGYALVWSASGERRLMPRGRALRAEDPIEIQFEDSRADARVVRVRPEKKEEAT
jgi:exodeoxyribonuclease VII large subunit